MHNIPCLKWLLSPCISVLPLRFWCTWRFSPTSIWRVPRNCVTKTITFHVCTEHIFVSFWNLLKYFVLFFNDQFSLHAYLSTIGFCANFINILILIMGLKYSDTAFSQTISAIVETAQKDNNINNNRKG